jgi:hypothetical protein
MHMPGKVIGISMNLGFPGTYSRNGDTIVFSRVVKTTDAAGPSFGDALVLNGDSAGGSFSQLGVFIAAGGAFTPALLAGVCAREVKTSLTWYPNQQLGAYAPGEECDCHQRGSVVIRCQKGTPVCGPSGGVYLRVAANANFPLALVGGWEAEPDAQSAAAVVKIPTIQWTTGLMDVNNTAEITMLTRNTA